jgi:quinol-cytochrome oxidoreductase complex cytochrome b subunit
MHLIALHENGSNNPLGVSSNTDRIYFHPYYSFKDLVGVFAFFLVLGYFVFFIPNMLGHPSNYTPANPMITPNSIVPELYFLPFYAILRAIPSKLGGVVAMFSAILILLFLPILDTFRGRSSAFSPLRRVFFWLFVTNFLILLWVGGQHVEEPYITLCQLGTAFYFAYFLIFIPLIGYIENVLFDLAT